GLQDALWAAGITNTHFTIVGDGSEREWLQNRLPGAEFTGVIRGDRLADAYANLDLFVFPSETETVGNVVLEAMASGVPVIAMARGGPKFIAASPASALLAQTEDELVAFTTRLIRDGGRRRAMGRRARAIVGGGVRNGLSCLRRCHRAGKPERAAFGGVAGGCAGKAVGVTVVHAVCQMLRHPIHFLATRWNWKAAVLSTLMRGGIFFGTALESGLAPAARALVVDAAFRVPMAGTCA